MMHPLPNSLTRETAPVVALHSSASGAHQWDDLRTQFSDRFELHAWDLPGYGSADGRADEGQGVSRAALPIIRKIEALKQPVHLIGHCFGGGVALKIALLRPELVKSLTLYEPAAFHVLKAADAEGRSLLEGFSALETQLSQPKSASDLQGFVDYWTVPQSWASLPPERQDKLVELAPKLLEDFRDLESEQWNLSDLQSLRIPTLIMVGMESPTLSQATAQMIAQEVVNAELALLPAMGHMAPIFDPDWVNPRILQHIARVQKAARPVTWPARVAA
ncbi:alpha/beta hydrolase [Shimia sp. R9_1]|uniref:alpha/beta fold hydrolase n=1 Tax=Shimia sp. R9_1 TaxID=2821111 RepID=UPI001ADC08E4|nr:alpha/beta hydrolase [Shimia sp. R9_1]MBO9409375.1 alpha/beta hydrolase [Shimia sp. R9_1]